MRWLKLSSGVCAVLVMMVVVTVAGAAGRHSGTVISVSSNRLVLDELGAAGKEQRLTLRLTPDTKVMLTVRNEKAEDFDHVFTTTSISAADIKPGDFVVVELSGGRKVADSVTVTLRKSAAAR